MNVDAGQVAPTPGGGNHVLWLVIGLPLLAVAASLTSVLLAFGSADAPLPERYHWEGSQLEADQARLDAAAQRGISAEFSIDASTGECRILLRGAAPASLQLDLAHATRAGIDQHVLLQRVGDAYVGRCAPLARGHWWLEAGDAQSGWLIRQRIGQ